MSYLSYKTPPTGFNYTSTGESQYQVHGLALCRGDYSNASFFGKNDIQNMFYAWSNQNASDPSSFNAKARKLLRELAKQASESPKMYKSGRQRIGEGRTIYGLARYNVFNA
ncbi:hypothetical protein FH972_014447 [Carpinus fangiana]|uniref:Uncharacterized protein n=1 Tax=Carpinus fangiana TaxID=176857 RepID=A0A5N6RAC7_9ROSI|nr:hypothetical protein FH972_014447 [Carpinus fangiana]